MTCHCLALRTAENILSFKILTMVGEEVCGNGAITYMNSARLQTLSVACYQFINEMRGVPWGTLREYSFLPAQY